MRIILQTQQGPIYGSKQGEMGQNVKSYWQWTEKPQEAQGREED